MSQEGQTLISTPLRKVLRCEKDGMYVVVELDSRHMWVEISKPYAHSTSAFAALGRITQRQTQVHLDH